ncbi:unnamed protein product [Periconia digitata]|uniref:Alpha/beta-hydrolase n=1 Tax=Periconia digitata TaxID=1303443 RepID=A0A9W4UHR3_9PLEO|nr:unnamed protein product [Periconia digitata]
MVSFQATMHSTFSKVVCAASAIIVLANAAPAPNPEPQLLSGVLGLTDGVLGLTNGILNALTADLNGLLNPQPKATPQSTEDVAAYLQQRYKDRPLDQGFIAHGHDYQLNGLIPQEIVGSTINTSPAGLNSFTNTNPKARDTIFPKADNNDPSYTVSEDQLRAAIYIPSSPDFTNATNPVLLVPGTGVFGGANFQSNFIKVLQQDPSIGQPAWLNVPGAQLGDVQTNSEYVAYAINYISSITGGHKVNVIGWSQGNLDTQWVSKYWPSCRSNIKQLISVSPDFHGTTLANLLDLPADLGLLPMSPAFLQQKRDSKLIKALRRDGGDSAYVPTTSFYSALFDEVVQPMSGKEASAYLEDVRGVGVSNIEIQSVCGAAPAGVLGTHESLLFNGLVMNLAIDALRNGGPAQTSRIDLAAVCQQAVYPSLDLGDVIASEATIPTGAINILENIMNGDAVYTEPALRKYAA